MPKRLFSLRSTTQTSAATCNSFAFDSLNICTTNRAMLRHFHRRGTVWALIQHNTDDLRDNITSSTDDHIISDLNPKPLNFVHVMQSRITNCHTTDKDRSQSRHRCHRSCTPNLKFDLLDLRYLFLRWKLMRNRPSWKAGDKA